MAEMRRCRKCEDEQPLKAFVVVKGYRSWTCNQCRHFDELARREAERNRKFNEMVKWRAVRWDT